MALTRRMGMRLAPLLFLLPALSAAQTVPSLGRTGSALPITESVVVLRARLGGKGGLFAAAQLALKGSEGRAALVAAKTDLSPLRRLDVAYGLGLRDDAAALLALASMLGDSDESVSIQAAIGIEHAGARAYSSLVETVRYGKLPSADAATTFLPDDLRVPLALDARTNGRAGAIANAYGGWYSRDPRVIPLALAALDDPRPGVRRAAVDRIVQSPASPARDAAVDRILRSTDPTVRLDVVESVQERYASRPPEVLIPLAADRDPRVRQAVGPVLAAMLDDSRPDVRLAPALARLVDDPDSNVADTTIEVLGLVANNAVQQTDRLQWDRQPPHVLATFRRGLVRRLAGPKRLSAAILLALTRDRRAYPVLAPLAISSRGGDRTVLLLALGTSGDPRATPLLLKLVSETNEGQVALAALGRGRDPAAVMPLLGIVRRDPKGLGISAAWSLGAIGNRRAGPALLAVASSLDLGYGANYLRPLMSLRTPGTREFALDVLERGPEGAVEEAGRALADLKDRAAIPALERIATGAGRRAEEAKRVLTALRRVKSR